ncbi:MAG TPA: ABC transporter permease [Thermoanaerobaculia bacterium]|nr:ABC transporter permease [Thermoanaerobaculia bacterium]
MIRHLLKLVWNRKRANALIIAEIFFSFLVLFAVITATVTFAANWRRPLGYDYSNVWNVRMDFDIDARAKVPVELRQSVGRMMTEARSFPEVESVAGTNTPPYSFSTSEGSWERKGRRIRLMFDDVTDDYAKVMRMKPIRGRWFGPEDDATKDQPVVLDVNAAEELFGNEDPIGKVFDQQDDGVMRVVGVVPAYRKDGELAGRHNMVFHRVALDRDLGRLGSNLVVRLRPGTHADFEERLVSRLQSVAPTVTFRIRHMDAMRESALRFRLAPVIAGAIVAAFLISMVALGLTGVLWQSVTKRTRELGLRRAMGATGSTVHRQILLEVALLATVAVIAGAVIVLQLPILGIFAWVTPAAFTTGFIASLATIYSLTVLCGLYPSWLASRLMPADALRYE